MAIIKELHPATHKCQIVNADADEISFSFFDSFVKKQRLKKEKYKTEFSIVNYPFFSFGALMRELQELSKLCSSLRATRIQTTTKIEIRRVRGTERSCIQWIQRVQSFYLCLLQHFQQIQSQCPGDNSSRPKCYLHHSHSTQSYLRHHAVFGWSIWRVFWRHGHVHNRATDTHVWQTGKPMRVVIIFIPQQAY